MVTQLRSHLLTWFGIIGSAVTIFSNLEGVIKLANWAKWVAEYWIEWMGRFWSTIFGWFSLDVPPVFFGGLTVMVFLISSGIGARFLGKSSEEPSGWKLIWLFCAILLSTVLSREISLAAIRRPDVKDYFDNATVFIMLTILLQCAILSILVYISILIFCNNVIKGSSFFEILFSLLFLYISTFAIVKHSAGLHGNLFASGPGGRYFMLVTSLLPSLLFIVASPRSLFIRLSHVVILLIVLGALSQISEIGIDIAAPPV